MIDEIKPNFRPFFIQETSIEKLGTWKAHLEILAATTFTKYPFMLSADMYKAKLITGESASPFSVDNLVSIDTGETHVEPIHINEYHFDPVIPVSSHGVS